MCLHLNVIQPNAFSISLKRIPALRLLDKLHPISIIPRLFVAPINRVVSTINLANPRGNRLTDFVSVPHFAFYFFDPPDFFHRIYFTYYTISTLTKRALSQGENAKKRGQATSRPYCDE